MHTIGGVVYGKILKFTQASGDNLWSDHHVYHHLFERENRLQILLNIYIVILIYKLHVHFFVHKLYRMVYRKTPQLTEIWEMWSDHAHHQCFWKITENNSLKEAFSKVNELVSFGRKKNRVKLKYYNRTWIYSIIYKVNFQHRQSRRAGSWKNSKT